MSSEAYVGLGANLGNPRETFEKALILIAGFAEVVAVSRLYRSSPFGFSDQPDFVNAVAKVITELPSQDILRKLRAVENALGKKVIRTNGPRVIDLDLLLHGNQVLDDEGLTIPHPGISSRDFVLAPLIELAPDFCHPVTGKSFREMLAELKEPFVSSPPEDWLPELVSPLRKGTSQGKDSEKTFHEK